MASYNHERFVGAMLDSILQQSVPDIELIVVDDGSTDATPTIVQRIAATDSRLRFVQQTNAGVVAARNLGIREARAEFITIVDSDDLLLPDHAERLLSLLSSSSEVVLGWGDAWMIDDDGRRIRRFSEIHPPRSGDLSFELFKSYCFIPAPSVMFRRSAMVASGLLWGSGPTTDYIKWIELGLLGATRQLSGEPVACWRHHGSNVSQSVGAKRAIQYVALVDDLSELLRIHSSLATSLTQDEVNRRYAHCFFMAGYYAALGDEWRLARTYFSRSQHLHRSLRAWLGQCSALPGINVMSRYTYRIVQSQRR